MILLALDSSISRDDLEAKLDRMGFTLKRNQFRHFTGVCLSIVEDNETLFLNVNNSPYDIEELLDYFYLRNLVTKKILKDCILRKPKAQKRSLE